MIVALGFSLLLNPLNIRAQSTDLPKYEVAADFTSLKIDRFTTLPGLGGRFTDNLNKHLALEAAGNEKWGVFAKVRPGFTSFGHRAFNVSPVTVGGTSRGQIQCYGPAAAGTLPCFRIEENRLTAAALDVGGVVEFYPSKRIVVRVDGGDTILRYAQRSFNTLTVDPANPTSGIPILVNVTDPGRTLNRIQFTAGVGFRF